MAYILHIDTSGKTGLIMISRDGQIVLSKENKTEKDHAATINLMIEAVLREAGITLNDLDAIAICTGPGSYTGLRIGMATAKGISYALDIPMISHNKLELLIGEKTGDEQRISIIPARVGEYFLLNNDASDSFSQPTHLLSNEINEYLKNISANHIVIFGNVMDDIISQKNMIVNTREQVDQHLWSILAFDKFIAKAFANIAHVEPLYIKSVFINKSR